MSTATISGTARAALLPDRLLTLWRLFNPPLPLRLSHSLDSFWRMMASSIRIGGLLRGNRIALSSFHPFAKAAGLGKFRVPLPSFLAPGAMCRWVASPAQGLEILHSIVVWVMIKMMHDGHKCSVRSPAFNTFISISFQHELAESAKSLFVVPFPFVILPHVEIIPHTARRF